MASPEPSVDPIPVMPNVPTYIDLIAEIEGGPLAAQLAPYWANVFVAPAERRPTKADLDAVDAAPNLTEVERVEAKSVLIAKASAHDVKTHRAGRLHPDAAFAIHAILWDGGAKSRASQLGWSYFPWKHVKRAKDQGR